MKKARLKINFTNSLGTRLKDEILVFKNDRYQVDINDNFGINKDFVESNPDIFEVFEEIEFEIGKWYEYHIGGFALYSDTKYKVGFDYKGYWVDDWEMCNKGLWKPANMNKVGELLLNECKKRFLIGTLCKDVIYGDTKKISKDVIYYAGLNAQIYCVINNIPWVLYNNGKFAEIISQPITKWLADEFQVLKLELYLDEKPTSPKGKFFDTEKEAIEYHKSLQSKQVIGIEIPEGYEIVYKQLYSNGGFIALCDNKNTEYKYDKSYQIFLKKQAAEKYIFDKKLEELKQQYNQ